MAKITFGRSYASLDPQARMLGTLFKAAGAAMCALSASVGEPTSLVVFAFCYTAGAMIQAWSTLPSDRQECAAGPDLEFRRRVRYFLNPLNN